MSGERDWVEKVKAAIEPPLAEQGFRVETGRRLPYSVHVGRYRMKPGEPALAHPETESYGYQTDLLIIEQLNDTTWAPRVVVEFKLKRVSTHDALTYSAKAATHKNVHPYLRYGIVIGGFDGPVPGRLMRHGHHFDFMLTIASETLTKADTGQLVLLLLDEVRAVRTLSDLLSGQAGTRLLHRRLDSG